MSPVDPRLPRGWPVVEVTPRDDDPRRTLVGIDSMKVRQTRHQVPRGSRPDADAPGKIYLFKRVSILHATYQIRLLAHRAQQERSQLVIKVPDGFKAGPSLKALMTENPRLIRLERG